MKRDVTQSGKRTQRGAVDDAMAAARRYFVNNLRDLRKQLGIDFLLSLAAFEDLVRQSSGVHALNGTANVYLNQYAPESYLNSYQKDVLLRLAVATVKLGGVGHSVKKLKKFVKSIAPQSSGCFDVSAKTISQSHEEEGLSLVEEGKKKVKESEENEENGTVPVDVYGSLDNVFSEIFVHIERLLT